MNAARNDTLQRRWIVALLLIGGGIALYLTLYVWRRVDRPAIGSDPRGDFSYFYTAAKAMANGQDIYDAQPPDKDRPGYIYPPLIAFLYQPLTRFTLPWAARISLLFNVAALACALAFAARALLDRLSREKKALTILPVAVLTAVLSIDKIKGELQMLQTNALIAAGIGLGLLLLDSSPFWAGAALGFAINIKYQALGLLLYMLIRKRWKAAGATAVWTAFWAFLPAVSVGFRQEAGYLVRGVAGVLRLGGMDLGKHVANVEPISAGFSVSITSAAARLLERHGSPMSPFLPAGIIALAWLALWAVVYRARRLPVLAWPADRAQQAPPWRALVGIEWVAVIASVLAFSPQTNMRHMVLTLFVNTLGVVALFNTRGKLRWIAGAGLAVLWLGFNLPPGSRGDDPISVALGTAGGLGHARAFWWDIGGPAWSLLIAMTLIAWAALALVRQHHHQPAMALREITSRA